MLSESRGADSALWRTVARRAARPAATGASIESGPRRVRRLVVVDGLRLLWFGLALGFLGAYFVASMLSAVLYEVHPHDPLVFVGVAVALFAICLLSVALPATRASRIPGFTANT